MQIGTIIKAFDFPGNLNCYMVGEVTAVDDYMITCRTMRQVFDGKAQELSDFNKTFRTVQQGEGMFDASFTRVMVIG